MYLCHTGEDAGDQPAAMLCERCGYLAGGQLHAATYLDCPECNCNMLPNLHFHPEFINVETGLPRPTLSGQIQGWIQKRNQWNRAIAHQYTNEE